jgi:peptidoglycan/LPS O-acetylase OafA/YrhL
MVRDLPAKPGGAERLHLGHVDGLRAIAASVVFLNHAYAQTWLITRGQVPPAELHLLSYFLVLGHLSVSVFIVLSGFCLALPLTSGDGSLRGGIASFYRRRARRILPPYYAAVALSLGLIWTVIGEPTGTLWDVPLLINPSRIISHLLLLQNLFGTGSINYVFWSIAVEWQIYLIFPVLVWSWRRFGPGITVTAALALGYAIAVGLGHTRLSRASPQYLGLFTLGMLAAHLSRNSAPLYRWLLAHVPWRSVAVVMGLSATLLMGWHGFRLSRNVLLVLDLLIGVLACALLVVTSRPGGSRLVPVLAWKPLAAIGVFSYSLYLVHAPLLQLLWQYVFHPLGLESTSMFLALTFLGFPVVLALSYLFHRLFEAPFMASAARPVNPTPRPSPT